MPHSRRRRDSFLPWILLGLDTAVLYGLLYGIFWLRFKSGYYENILAPASHAVYYRAFHLIVLIFIFFLRFYGLYGPTARLTFSQETSKVFKAALAGTLVLMSITFFVRDFSYSRSFLILVGAVAAPGISSARFLLGLGLMGIDHRRGSFRNVLVLGADDHLGKLTLFYKRNPRFATRVVGLLDDRMTPGEYYGGVPVLGRLNDLPSYLEKKYQVHEVVLAQPGLSREAVLGILYQCEKEMVTFRWIADIFGLMTAKMKVSSLGGVSVLSFMDSPLFDWENRVLKRMMDIAVSLLGLVLFLPFFLLIALWVKRDSGGPVFFRQDRLGEDGHQFTLYKFRTMRSDAEDQTGPVWARENDDRRTKLGARLRAHNLDELPQLWNVLIGDMSLVGPRPERPFFASRFKEDVPRYMSRHAIRSGITGWAQVNGWRGNTSIQERTKHDLYYIENWSLALDLKILFMTFFARENAY